MSEAKAQLPVVLNQEYRVKLGKSFTFPKENAFHTIKCKMRSYTSPPAAAYTFPVADDFKPKSVDSSQPGRLKVEGEEVTVSLPLFQVPNLLIYPVLTFSSSSSSFSSSLLLLLLLLLLLHFIHSGRVY